MACAPQHAVLFEASLRDNLLLGADLPDQTVEEWLHRLGLSHLLECLLGHLRLDPSAHFRFHVFDLFIELFVSRDLSALGRSAEPGTRRSPLEEEERSCRPEVGHPKDLDAEVSDLRHE